MKFSHIRFSNFGIGAKPEGLPSLNADASFTFDSMALSSAVDADTINTSTDFTLGAATLSADSSIVTTPAYQALILGDSPVGYWRLGESSGTTAVDLTINNDGTYTNTPTLGVTGAIVNDADTAVTFTSASSEYVGMGDVLDFERTESFSLEAWIKTSTSGVVQAIINKRDSGATGYSLNIGATNSLGFVLRNSAINGIIVVEVGSISLVDGSWHHVVSTYDGSSTAAGITIYIDGAAQTDTDSQDNLSATTLTAYAFNIGAENNSANFFNGQIDEVAVYNTELTATQVEEHYNQGISHRLTESDITLDAATLSADASIT